MSMFLHAKGGFDLVILAVFNKSIILKDFNVSDRNKMGIHRSCHKIL